MVMYMNHDKFIGDHDAMQLNDSLKVHSQIESEIIRMVTEKTSVKDRIREIGTSALKNMCDRQDYSVLERAAFSAMFDDPDIPKDITDLAQRMEDAGNRLRSLDTILREKYAPILAFTAGPAPRRTRNLTELLGYTCRLGDGTGLTVAEHSVGMSHRYIHEISIGEEPYSGNRDARQFGQVSPADPIVYRRNPWRIIDWSNGPELAASNLSTPPRQSPVTHLLIGHTEIRSFFRKCDPSEQLDTIYGHVSLMGFDFSD